MDKKHGFTLVELLVVIAIISLLAGLLLPVLEDALDAATTLRCANNQKQVVMATFGYAEDNDGWTFMSRDLSVWPAVYQYDKLLEGGYLDAKSNKFADCQILYCPLRIAAGNGAAKPYAFRGYYYTYFKINAPKILARSNTLGVATAESLPHSKFILWCDAGNGSGTEYVFQPTGGYVFQLRHTGGAIGPAVCADGHVGCLGVDDLPEYGVTAWLLGGVDTYPHTF